MVLTSVVISFHRPLRPATSACPPIMPSTPTSFATRCTSLQNIDRRSTMLLIVSLRISISPLASTSIFRLMSPFAMACVTVDIPLTYKTRPKISTCSLCINVQTNLVDKMQAHAGMRPASPKQLATHTQQALQNMHTGAYIDLQ